MFDLWGIQPQPTLIMGQAAVPGFTFDVLPPSSALNWMSYNTVQTGQCACIETINVKGHSTGLSVQSAVPSTAAHPIIALIGGFALKPCKGHEL